MGPRRWSKAHHLSLQRQCSAWLPTPTPAHPRPCPSPQILPRYSYSVHGASHLLALSLTTALGVLCYLLCVFVDPGAPPLGWAPDAEARGAVQEVKRSGAQRVCAKCDGRPAKPPRTHHCRVCGRCVLRFDHHCKWTNNCVGQGNYRAFMLMCVYLTVATLHALGLFLSLDASLAAVAGGWDEESRMAAGAGAAEGAGSSEAGDRAGSWGLGARLGVRWEGPLWTHLVIQVARLLSMHGGLPCLCQCVAALPVCVPVCMHICVTVCIRTRVWSLAMRACPQLCVWRWGVPCLPW